MRPLLSKIPILALTLLVGLIASSTAFGTATIIIQNNDPAGVGFNDPASASPVGGNTGTTVGQQRLNAFQFAADIWGSTLTSATIITIQASWAAQTCTANTGTLGSAGAASIFRNFPGAPFSNTWYSVALANALAGSDLNPTTVEINARFNFNVGKPGCLENLQWYYGLDNNHGGNGIDLVAVLLHEFGHGLGFQTFTNTSTGQQAGTSPNLFPSIYDKFLFDNSTSKTWDQMTDAERVASAINTTNLTWNGSQVDGDAATVLTAGKDSSGRPRMFAPGTLQRGSSVSHWDTTATPNQLMEPNISGTLSHSVTTPQDLTFSLLRDIGWCSGCPQPPPPPPPTPTPTPAANNNFANAQILTLTGCAGSVTGHNFGANKEAGEPSHSPDGDPGGGSVWYQWQAPSSGSVTMTTAGSDYDTLLAVYTGTTLNGIDATAVVKNDDVDPGNIRTSIVTFNATAGTLYKIAVDGWDNDRGNIVLNLTQSPCTQAMSAQLSLASYQVQEGAGTVQITVNRANTTAAATVNYATSDAAGLTPCTTFNLRASERCDYATSVGTLVFKVGDSSKSFIIPIVDDAHVEGDETFTVSLTAATGAVIGSPQQTTVTIVDNATPVQNPIDVADFYVTQLYIDFLGRLPDQIGFNNWVSTINGCPGGGFGTANPTCDRVHAGVSFYQGDEFQTRGYFVYKFYEVAFDRRATYGEFIPDMALVGGPKNPAEEAAAKLQYMNEFVLRSEFVSRYGGLSNAAYVNALETNAEVTVTNKQALIDALSAGTMTRAEVLRNIVESVPVENQFYYRGFVTMMYFGFVRRNPDQTGFNNYLVKLTQTNDPRAMAFDFIYSTEYRGRFGPP